MLTDKLQTVQFFAKPGEIHLGIGHPAANLLPKSLLAQASEHLLAQTNTDFLQYGADAGDAYFRTSLAEFLTEAYGLAVAPETLFISGGISQALDMLCSSFSKPNDIIFVEEPSYFLALSIFRDYGLQIMSIPINEQGLDVDALEILLRSYKPRFVYTIPAHQNPTGTSLSQERREKLIELAEQHDFLILADEVYQLLSYGSETPKPMAQFSPSEHVFSLSSFSKILAPGLRLGWVQTAPKHLETLMNRGIIQSGGGFSPFTAAIVKTAIGLGLQADYLSFLKSTYKERLNRMDEALKDLPVSYQKPQGGYFFWLELPTGVSAAKLHKVAQENKLDFQVGSKFSSRSELDSFIRLCFSYYDVSELQEGVNRLKTSLEICLNDLK